MSKRCHNNNHRPSPGIDDPNLITTDHLPRETRTVNDFSGIIESLQDVVLHTKRI